MNEEADWVGGRGGPLLGHPKSKASIGKGNNKSILFFIVSFSFHRSIFNVLNAASIRP
jgi:hypothetical protein